MLSRDDKTAKMHRNRIPLIGALVEYSAIDSSQEKASEKCKKSTSCLSDIQHSSFETPGGNFSLKDLDPVQHGHTSLFAYCPLVLENKADCYNDGVNKKQKLTYVGTVGVTP